jgi:polyhydroxyalkanoate synthesis regulator phasin
MVSNDWIAKPIETTLDIAKKDIVALQKELNALRRRVETLERSLVDDGK